MANTNFCPDSKNPHIDNNMRAAELRAKLLAKKPSNVVSRQQSPAVKVPDDRKTKKPNTHDMFKQTNGSLVNPQNNFKSTANGPVQTPTDTHMDGSSMSSTAASSGNTVTNDDFAFLFAEAKNAAESQKQTDTMANSGLVNSLILETQTGNRSDNDLSVEMEQVPPTTMQKETSNSDLLEPGEIHSDTSTPTRSPSTTLKSNFDSRKADQANEDRREKLIRQNEVSKAYQPLKESKSPTSAPRKSSWEVSSSESPTMSSGVDINSTSLRTKDETTLPKATPTQSKQQPQNSKHRQKASHEHPFHPSAYNRDQQDERSREQSEKDNRRDVRRSSLSQKYSNSTEPRRDIESYRRKMTEENSRRAAEYKRNLEIQGFPVRQANTNKSKSEIDERPANDTRADQAPTNGSPTEHSGRSIVDSNNILTSDNLGERGHNPIPAVASPNRQYIEIDSDINDWLELTNYYDLDLRIKRLALFRKKKRLEMERAELEREEMELQGISYLPQNQYVLPTRFLTKTMQPTSVTDVEMPPPPLPVTSVVHDVGIKIKDTALSAGLPASRNPTPTNKRSHADDDSDARPTQPAGKIARVVSKNNQQSKSPSNATAHSDGSKLLERRISRDYGDGQSARPLHRSRSPDFRHRSRSPIRRRFLEDYSPERRAAYDERNPSGVRRDRHCFNCGRPGHEQYQCSEPRRDGSPWDGERNTNNRYQKWVSPNYRGRNPVSRLGRDGNLCPHNHQGDNKSRYDFVKHEDIEMVDSRDNIGSGPLNLGAGGKAR